MRIGLVARADLTGLGIQTRGFYDNLKPAKTLAIDLSHLNGQQNDWSMYPDATILRHTPYPATVEGTSEARKVISEFLDDLDLVFTCETPYDYFLFTEAKRRNIKTVLQYNFELCDHILDPNLPRPDLFVAPSWWRFGDLLFHNKVFIPVPVDRAALPFKKRTSVDTFLHVVGNPAMEDRNGTQALLNAWRHVNTARLIIRTQSIVRKVPPKVEVISAKEPDYTKLYNLGDAFILPRKFGGLCLPLNEAMSVGMPVVMTNLEPQNEFLHPFGLVPATLSHQAMTKSMIDIYEPDTSGIAATVNAMSSNPDLVAEMSAHSNRRAAQISWEALLPIYLDAFELVLEGGTPPQVFEW